MFGFSGWKTGVFFVLTCALGVAELAGFSNFELTHEQAALYSVILSIAGLFLRSVTDSPAAWVRKFKK